MLAAIFRAFMLRRLFGAASRRRRPSYGYGYGRRSSGGFGLRGPFPTYSRRTRGGSRVTVTGCCLPIPLGVFAALSGLLALRRRR